MSSSDHWVSSIDGYLEPKITESGYGSRPAETTIHLFQETVNKYGKENALAEKKTNWW